MFFSVIVPVYNVESYLRKCLDSLVRQTCTDKEIILVDDGSTDSSGAICDEYAKMYDFVRVVHQENQGLSGARNTGIERATGEWLSFVDSDDWVDTDMLERLMGYIIATRGDMYRFGHERVHEDNAHNIFVRRQAYKGAILTPADEQALFRCYVKNLVAFMSAWGGVYRHSIIRDHHLRFVDTAEVYSEEVLFNFQYILHARKIVVLHDTPYHYRFREGSLTSSITTEQRLLRTGTLLERAAQTVKKQGLVYFQQHFHEIYIALYSYQIGFLPKSMSDAQVRQLLDKLSRRSKLYRHCIRCVRQQDGDTPTVMRQWYASSFGKKGRSPIAWRAYLLMKSLRYAIKGMPPRNLAYTLCKEQRVAYVVNFKCACSTIIVSMMRRNDIQDDYSVFHAAARQGMYRFLPPINDKQWFTFTFVRNPFARLVSCYESKYHDDKTRNGDAIRRGYLDFDYYLDGYIREDEGFARFVEKIVRIPYPLADYHFCSLYHRLIGSEGKPLVDFIGKVEHLEADYEPIRRKYGFAPLQHYNKVDYGDWRDYYTTKLAKKVYRKYKKDVQYFGYEEEYRDLLDYCARKEKGLPLPSHCEEKT